MLDTTSPVTARNPDDYELRTKEDLDRLVVELSDMSDETAEQASMRADFILLAAQARRRLTLPRAIEVATYLRAGRSIARHPQFLAQATKMYQRAATLFTSYANARNRLRYLSGVLLGFCVTVIFSIILRFIVRWLVDGSSEIELSFGNLAPLFLFCGMGTFVSVLTRLASMDLSDEVDARLVMISGAARPVVAIFLAIVVYVIIYNGFIAVHFGSAAVKGAYQPAVGWVAAFLTGFSERFATDFIGSLPFPGAGQSAAPRGSVPPASATTTN